MARAGSADLPDGESEIFFWRGLDRANQLEIAREIRLCAHVRIQVITPVGTVDYAFRAIRSTALLPDCSPRRLIDDLLSVVVEFADWDDRVVRSLTAHSTAAPEIPRVVKLLTSTDHDRPISLVDKL